MSMIYLAGPMDYCVSAGVSDVSILRKDAITFLGDAGFAVFDPTTAYKNAMVDPAAVMAMNDTAIERSDALLAVWPPEIMSVGTPMEIALAHRLDIPIVVIGPIRSLQLQAMGIPIYSTTESVEEAVITLQLLIAASSTVSAVQTETDFTLKYTGDVFHEPWRQHADDAGFDLIVSETVVIPPSGFVDVPMGICVELPPGFWGMLTGRSSTLRNKGLLVGQGVIDGGYRGPMFAGVQNMTDREAVVNKGDRIAQLIPLPLMTGYAENVGQLSESERGTQGFGSSGV